MAKFFLVIRNCLTAVALGEAGHGAATLMAAAPNDAMAFHRVDPKVNSNRASGPELIEPIPT